MEGDDPFTDSVRSLVSGIDSSNAASTGSSSGLVSGESSNAEEAAAGICLSTLRMGTGVLVGMGGGVTAAAGVIRGAAATGADGRGGDICGGACTDGAASAAAGFAASALRSSPRATRNVPFDCSTLIGLVRTRFAPRRKAFATPACPSTTATDNALWFKLELRALLKSKVAFCSFSQSTTTASKRCPMSILTAANGSEMGSTRNSRSIKT